MGSVTLKPSSFSKRLDACSALCVLIGLPFTFLVTAVDGGYSEWSAFSDCNASCGSGLKIRKRSCNSPEPKNGGKDCSSLGPDMDSVSCNSFPCRKHFTYVFVIDDDLSNISIIAQVIIEMHALIGRGLRHAHILL